jgi:hypothetical protein
MKSKEEENWLGRGGEGRICRIFIRKLEAKTSGRLRHNWGIILKATLKEYDLRIWIRFNWRDL